MTIVSCSRQPVLTFYLGAGRDGSGRTIHDVQAFDADQLEAVHNYIQWLFPLIEASKAVPNAPIISLDEVAIFRQNASAQTALRQSFDVMLEFYGFAYQLDDRGRAKIVRGPNYGWRKRVWLSRSNHNFLRISRILRSLRLLGLQAEAIAFLECLKEVYYEDSGIIGQETMNFWQLAVHGDPPPGLPL